MNTRRDFLVATGADPVKFEVVVNLKTARSLGVVLPQPMTMRRKLLLLVGGALVIAPFTLFAQPQLKVRRLGFLVLRSRPTPENPDHYAVFVQAMRELGYVEGQNLIIEWAAAEGQYARLPALASELIRKGVEVIVTHGTPGTRAAQDATSVVPIVTAAVSDPIGGGFASSLARPGSNVTGLSLVIRDISPKHIEFLKTMVPGLASVAVLNNPDNSSLPDVVRSIQAAAEQARIRVFTVNARTPAEIATAYAAMNRQGAQAAIVASDPFLAGQRPLIAASMLKYRVPSISPFREDAEAGSLMSYGQDMSEFYRRAAIYVDKILKGAKAGELPFEQPTKFELVINMKTAKALGISIPPSILVRADKVIE